MDARLIRKTTGRPFFAIPKAFGVVLRLPRSQPHQWLLVFPPDNSCYQNSTVDRRLLVPLSQAVDLGCGR